MTDHRYGPESEHVLDVMAPVGAAASGASPLVVVVHGGAWRTGDRSLARSVQRGLAARGAIAVAIEHRMRQPDPVSDMVDDIRRAVGWLVGSDLLAALAWDGTVTLVGDSAGGHAVVVAAMRDAGVGRVVSLCGALSLDALRHPVGADEAERFPGYAQTICGADEAPGWPRLDRVDPLLLRRGGLRPPPMLAATSVSDFFRESTLRYVEGARELGDDVALHLESDGACTHSWFLDESTPATARLLDAVAAWIAATPAAIGR